MRKFINIYYLTMQIILLICGIISSVFAGIFLVECLSISTMMNDGIGLILPLVYVLVLTPLIIISFIAARSFSNAKSVSDEELFKIKGKMLAWGIVFSIIFTPTFIGIFVFLPPAIVSHVFINKLEENAVLARKNENVEVVKDGSYKNPQENFKQTNFGENVGNIKEANFEVLKEEEIEDNNEKTFGQKVKQGFTNVVEGTKDVLGIKSSMEKMREEILAFKQLLDDGLITQEEFEAKKKQILKLD